MFLCLMGGAAPDPAVELCSLWDELYITVLKLFLKRFIYLFLERREGREKETDRNSNVWLPLACPQLGTCPATQACALTGNQT